MTLDEAAAKYIREQAEKGLPSVDNDATMLKPLIAMAGSLTIDQVCDATLQEFIQARRAQGCTGKTINHTLGSLRSILNRAASTWLFENGMTWLAKAPSIAFVSEEDKKPPRPLARSEQETLFAELPAHLKAMVLFSLNTGVRENVVCSLQWEWEAKIKIQKDQQISVFVVPREFVKGRKHERVLVCNSIAQGVIDGQRGIHGESVFAYPKPVKGKPPQYHPVQHINNNGWQKARERAGLSDLRVHDLRHTVGMRLRNAGVSERTQDAILWHSQGDMTNHYAVAQLREIYNALESITVPSEEFETLDLHALIRRTQMRRLTANLPHKEKEPKQLIA